VGMQATREELRKFAWIMMAALTVFGTIAFYRGSYRAVIYFYSIAGIFLLFGLVMPTALAPVYRVWMGFAHVLSQINTTIILSLLFYIVLTPISLIMKLTQRDVLKKKFDRTSSTYWHSHKPMKSAKEHYEHLY
jgi:Saxitoxin biosynthesis operon protein SxtJ